MSFIPSPDKQWYVVHVLSGQEQRVRDRILRQAEVQELQDKIFEVLVPMETISEVKRGKKTESRRKFYPGYIIINMDLLREGNELVEDTWYFIKEMEGVIGFAGTKTRPVPMRQREVDAMLNQIKEREEQVRPAVTFEVGDSVKIADGAFEGQTGVVEVIDMEKGTLSVSVTIFGRATPVELEFWQVTKE